MTRREKKQQIPQEQPPGCACITDVGRTKAYQMDHSSHFQLCINLDPLASMGFKTVSNKQLVIASMSSVRYGHTQQRKTRCKQQQQKNFLCLCLFNE